MLAPAPEALPSARMIDLARLAALAAHVVDAGGHTLILRTSSGDLHLAVHGPSLTGAFTVLIPVGDDLGLRIAAAARFDRVLRGRVAGDAPKPWRLTAQQRLRLAYALRALDGHLAGASQREIARVLFGRAISGRAWVGSDLHSRTKRALTTGRQLMRGGYRALLAAPSRRGVGNRPH